MRDQETETALEEAEIRNLELELQKKMFEQVMGITKDVKKSLQKQFFQVYFNYSVCDYFSHFIVNFKHLI